MTTDAPIPYREALRDALRDVELARRIHCLDETPSTNDYAAQLARHGRDPAATAAALHGTLVVADHQTAGRGRFRRSWIAPPGTALLFTLVLDRAQAPPAAVALAAPVACCDAIAALAALPARVKYPNDILLRERKAGGILLEQPPGTAVVLAGIGINVAQQPDDLPPPTHVPPTSLAIEAAPAPPPGRAPLLAALIARLGALLHPAALPALPARMNALCDTIGRHVEVTTAGGTLAGVAICVADDGALVVRTDQGMQHAVYSGDIRQLRT